MSDYAIPEKHQLRQRYTKGVLDRLRFIGQVTKTVNGEIESMIQQIEEGNWDHVSEALHDTFTLLDGAADKSLTAANFAASLEMKR